MSTNERQGSRKGIKRQRRTGKERFRGHRWRERERETNTVEPLSKKEEKKG